MSGLRRYKIGDKVDVIGSDINTMYGRYPYDGEILSKIYDGEYKGMYRVRVIDFPGLPDHKNSTVYIIKGEKISINKQWYRNDRLNKILDNEV